MHEVLRSHDVATGRLADRLMTQTNAQERYLASKTLHARHGDASFIRCARPGRNDEVARLPTLYVIHRHLVIAFHADLECGVDFSQPLHQVVRKRIVVIEQENHAKKSSAYVPKITPLDWSV